MKKVFLIAASLFAFCNMQQVVAQESEKQIVVKNRENNPEQVEKPYVILISIDGFRFDYIEKHQANFLKELASKGVQAESLIPSYPSVTFPNHYSIVTGLYPGHHGLVGNNMLDVATGERYSLRNKKAVTDPKWYGGTPLWVLAEQQGMMSACYYWPGSEAPIQNTLPSYYYEYSEKTDMGERIKAVEEWLALPERFRPHFITFYLPEVDHAGHTFGPDAPQTREAVQFVDESIRDLFAAVRQTKLDVNFIIVSDHGMLELDQKTLLEVPVKIDDKEVSVVSNGTYVSLFVKDKKNIDKWYNKLQKAANPDLMKVYTTYQLPEEYKLGSDHDRYGRVGDIILTANEPYYFTNKALAGSHGFDPKQVREMQGLFIAHGPNIVPKGMIPSFENVNIYPIVTSILGLQSPEEIEQSKVLTEEERMMQANNKANKPHGQAIDGTREVADQIVIQR
ncbi:MAG: ectonucleotide pyrophosphatase/phosphodiesterase [Flavobacteriaceae bacterium]|jgi:predicted AlkP superfamily pyrophosphatase or phosphodiesterase|nr:ectonucleotide pyrophosphatase/phosphodiesterase [Flavobacteriaceae bacterium]